MAFRDGRLTGADKIDSHPSSGAACRETSWPSEPRQAMKWKAAPHLPLDSKLPEVGTAVGLDSLDQAFEEGGC